MKWSSEYLLMVILSFCIAINIKDVFNFTWIQVGNITGAFMCFFTGLRLVIFTTKRDEKCV